MQIIFHGSKLHAMGQKFPLSNIEGYITSKKVHENFVQFCYSLGFYAIFVISISHFEIFRYFVIVNRAHRERERFKSFC